MSDPITDKAREAARNEVNTPQDDHTGERDIPLGYYVQQLLTSEVAAATKALREERDEWRRRAGWWNCQVHGETAQQCQCGAATVFVTYKEELQINRSEVADLLETHEAEITALREENERLTKERDELKTERDRTAAVNELVDKNAEAEITALRTRAEAAERERDESKRHDEQMNAALGKLAPKGTWICEVLENIWRAETSEAANEAAQQASQAIQNLGFWTGPRINEALHEKDVELTTLRATYEGLQRALSEANELRRLEQARTDERDATIDTLRAKVEAQRAALEACAESLAFARDKLCMTGEGDGKDRKADAEDSIGSLCALKLAAIALSEPESTVKEQSSDPTDAPSDGSPCVICGQPITPYDCYGVGAHDPAGVYHRYHWDCVAATVGPSHTPATETPTPETDKDVALRQIHGASVMYVGANFARSLERRLTAVTAERDRLLRELQKDEDNCPRCGSGLRYCGPQDPVTHVPTIECRLCQLVAERDAALRELAAYKEAFGAAKRYIDANVCDPETTAEMWDKFTAYETAKTALDSAL